jgi:hypothetical protein
MAKSRDEQVALLRDESASASAESLTIHLGDEGGDFVLKVSPKNVYAIDDEDQRDLLSIDDDNNNR